MVQEKSKNNLIKLGDRPLEERRRIASMGGKAKRKADMEQRSLRNLLEIYLSMPCVSNGQPLKHPHTGQELSYKEAMAVRLAIEATKGNMKAIRMIAELTGELATQPTIENNMIIDVSES